MLTRRVSCLILIVMLTGLAAYPQDKNPTVRIGLLSLEKPLSLTVNITGGDYRLMTDGNERIISENDNILINRAGERVVVSTYGRRAVIADSVAFYSLSDEASLTVRNNFRTELCRQYYGDLIVLPDIESLMVINSIDEESYLAGVVQTEAGLNGELEYYKTQTLLARTYLYMNIKKHIRDGYNLCDKTHCQAYHGRSDVDVIKEAVHLTRGMVLVNADSMLVFTPFHSNCGGQTESPENVWLTPMSHLSSVVDPYCGFSRNARWTDEIPLDEWISYLGEHGYQHLDNKNLVFEQLSRQPYYTAGSFSIPLTSIREKWGLRSTFFSVSLEGDRVVLEGRGYGHGVGLCQEGAKVMTGRGFRMEEVIAFYFRGLKIIDIGDAKPQVEISSPF